MHLLTEWEGWTGKYLDWGHGILQGPCTMTGSQCNYFSDRKSDLTQSVSILSHHLYYTILLEIFKKSTFECLRWFRGKRNCHRFVIKLGTYLTSHIGSTIAIKMWVTVLVLVVYCWRKQCLKAFSGNNRTKPKCTVFPLKIDISWISSLYTYV